MTERVQKTLEFLREQFENSAYFREWRLLEQMRAGAETGFEIPLKPSI